MLLVFLSTSGHRIAANHNTHFYGATKHALKAITEGLRREMRSLKSHIRVSVCIIDLFRLAIKNSYLLVNVLFFF